MHFRQKKIADNERKNIQSLDTKKYVVMCIKKSLVGHFKISALFPKSEPFFSMN